MSVVRIINFVIYLFPGSVDSNRLICGFNVIKKSGLKIGFYLVFFGYLSKIGGLCFFGLFVCTGVVCICLN